MLSFLKGEANLILRNLLNYEKDVIITYETHNNNDVVAIYWECDDICFQFIYVNLVMLRK